MSGQAGEIDGGAFPVLPRNASSFAGEVDAIALTWTVFSAVILLLVFGMLATFSVRYLGREVAVRKIRHKARTLMEWSWSLALLAISLSICVWAARLYIRMRVPPENATSIYVVAKQWMWKIQHEDGMREIDELHVPLGEPIRLVMSSQDVIHSFFVPAFRTKQDVVPGRYTTLWFTATRPGDFQLFCAEYCGTSHSTMTGKIHVMEKADFLAWKSAHLPRRPNQDEASLAARGRALFTRHGCVSCHESGSPVRAPALEGLYLRTEGMRTGETVLADESYLRESILDPSARIVQGFENLMPSFQGQLSEEDLMALIAYLKSLQLHQKDKK